MDQSKSSPLEPMVRPAAKARTPICATRAEAPPLPGCSRGFTLVELLVALALVGMMVALVPAAVGRLRESADYRDAVGAVLADLRTARQAATVQGRESRFKVDLAERTYGLEGATPRLLPQPLQIRVIVAGIESAGQQAAIRFLAQGGSTGGSIEVLRPGGIGVRITVDWLSALVSQTPIEP